MSLRFYLQSEPSAFSSPAAWRGSWDLTTNAITRRMGIKNGAQTTRSQAETSTTNNYDVAWGRWMSDPMKAHNFLTSETVSWGIQVLESNAALNAYFHVHIYVMAPDGSVRGTLLANSIGTTEFTTSFVGRTEGGKALSAVSMLDGDFIVFEVGYRAVNTVSTSYSGQMKYGGRSTSDVLPGTSNADPVPWVEFSENLQVKPINYIDKLVKDFVSADGDIVGDYTVSGGALVMTPVAGDTAQSYWFYDLTNSQIVFDFKSLPTTNNQNIVAVRGGLLGPYKNIFGSLAGHQDNFVCYFDIRNAASNFIVTVRNTETTGTSWSGGPYTSVYRFLRIKDIGGGQVQIATSPDNANWTTRSTVSYYGDLTQVSVLLAYLNDTAVGSYEIDAINPPAASNAGAFIPFFIT